MEDGEKAILSIGVVIIALLATWGIVHEYEMNYACQDIGYDDFTLHMRMPNCIGEEGFTFVYMDCPGIFFEDCKATPVDIGNIRIIDGG